MILKQVKIKRRIALILYFLSKKFQRGFTTLEVLMVVGIAAFLVSTAGAIYSNLREAQLRQAPLQLIEHLRQQQQRSCVQYNDNMHGVKLEGNKYTLFQGESYNTRDPQYDIVYELDDAISLCWTLVRETGESGGSGSGGGLAGSEFTNEVTFSQSGCKIPVSTGLIAVSHVVEGTKIININPLGRIAYQPEVDEYCHCEAGFTNLVCEEVPICHHPPGVNGVYPTCNGQGASIYIRDNIIIGGPDNGQVYSGVLNGTGGADVIVGSIGDDEINGNGGDDVICGRGGNNIITGSGADYIFSKRGDDIINLGNGSSRVVVEGGDNVINGGNGMDFIITGAGNDTIHGGNAKDVIISYGGDNNINAGGDNGKDIVCTGNGNDIIEGGNGKDLIDSHGGNDTINGGHAPDVCLNGENLTDCENTIESIPECEGYTYYEEVGEPICHYPPDNPFITQTIFVPESDVAYHLFHGDIEGVCDQDEETRTIEVDGMNILAHLEHGDGIGECVEICHVYPDTIIDGDGGEEGGEGEGGSGGIIDGTVPGSDCFKSHKIGICHIPPGNPENAHNICVGIASKKAHIDHGDTLSGCTQELAGSQYTMLVNQDNVDDHMAHGDNLGACEAIMTICHEGANINILVSEWNNHIAHGDLEGECPSDQQIVICHEGVDLNILQSEWLSHQLHGDTQGSCPTIPGPCGTCEGKVQEMTLKYNGFATSTIKIRQKQGEIVFNQIVYPQDQFTFSGVDNQNTLSPDIDVLVNDILNAEFHTSCSAPIGVGMVDGDFEIMSGFSREGGALCEYIE